MRTGSVLHFDWLNDSTDIRKFMNSLHEAEAQNIKTCGAFRGALVVCCFGLLFHQYF